MSQTYFIKEISTSDQTDFDNENSLFSSYQWMKLFETTYHIHYKKIVDEKDYFILHFALIEHAFAKKISILPFSDYVDFSRVTPHNLASIFEYLNDAYPAHDLVYKSNFHEAEIPINLNIKTKACYHRIPTRDISNFYLKPSFKSKVNKAKKLGLTARFNHQLSAIDDFYELYVDLRFTKFNIIPQPLSFFYAVHESYIKTKQGFTLEVLHDNHVIASAIILKHKNILYYKYSCSSSKHLSMAPNNLLMHTLIEYAKGKGFDYVDLGLSELTNENAGLRAFKESCGGKQYPIHYLSVDNDKTTRAQNPLKKLTGTIVNKRMSKEDTSALSEVIYPYFA